MKKIDCTLLISSCDKYEDLWYPFFELLKKYWPNLNMPIVLNTESKVYKHKGFDIKCYSFYNNENVQWSKRLYDHLEKINTKYILFMLDDFFITDYVDDRKLEQYFDIIDKDDKIAVMYLVRINNQGIVCKDNSDFIILDKKAKYRLNCQVAIWRKESLKKMLRMHESPWHFETLGSKRSHRFSDKFYAFAKESDSYVIKYDHNLGGAIHRGKWTKNTPELLKRNDIEVDFSIRGMSSGNSTNTTKINHVISNLSLKKILEYFITRFKSYI